jgi:hypothetical protein
VDDLEVEDDTKVDELGALNLHLLQLEDENQEDETLMVGKNNQTLLKNKETGLKRPVSLFLFGSGYSFQNHYTP